MINANGGNLCTLQIETNVAERRIKGTIILNIKRADMIVGWKTGTMRYTGAR
jgi:hypothetical protein